MVFRADDDAALSEKTEPDPKIFGREPVKLTNEFSDLQWFYCKFVDDGGIDWICRSVLRRGEDVAHGVQMA